MTYRVRPALHFWRVADGVQVQTWTGEFVIRGSQSLYTLCERVIGLLEVGTTRGELKAAVPSGVRDVALRVVDELVARNAVIDSSALSVPDVARDLRSAFADAVGYLESVAADPYAAFERLRKAKVLAIGGGPAYFAAVRSLADMGMANVDCRPLGDRRIAERLREHLSGRGHLQGTVEPVDDLEAGLASGCPWTLAAYVREGMQEEDLRRFEAAAPAVAESAIACVATRRGGVVGPLSKNGSVPGLGDAVTWLGRRGSGIVRGDELPAPVLGSIVGNLVGMRAFEHLTGVKASSDEAHAIVVRGETLETTTHPLDAIREGPVVGQTELGDRLEAFRRVSAPPSADAFLDASETLIDPVFGIVSAPRPGRLPQAPLSLSSCARVSLDGSPANGVLGVGATEAEARHSALVNALRDREHYSHGGDRVCVARLDDGAARDAEAGSLVMAAGHCFADWLADGIQRLLLRRVLGGAGGWGGRWTTVEPHAIGDPSGQVCWRSLTTRFGRTVRVVRATGTLPSAHGAAVVEREKTVAAGAGNTADEAVSSALRTALARVQIEEGGSREGLLPSLVFGTARGRAAHYMSDPLPAQPRNDWVDAMLASLRGLDQRVVVGPWGSEAVLQCGLLLGWVGIEE